MGCWLSIVNIFGNNNPDSKVNGANMGPIWGRQGPGGPHIGPMNFAIWEPCCEESQYILYLISFIFSLSLYLLSVYLFSLIQLYLR